MNSTPFLDKAFKYAEQIDTAPESFKKRIFGLSIFLVASMIAIGVLKFLVSEQIVSSPIMATAILISSVFVGIGAFFGICRTITSAFISERVQKMKAKHDLADQIESVETIVRELQLSVTRIKDISMNVHQAVESLTQEEGSIKVRSILEKTKKSIDENVEPLEKCLDSAQQSFPVTGYTESLGGR